jgi:hypothetical protein
MGRETRSSRQTLTLAAVIVLLAMSARCGSGVGSVFHPPVEILGTWGGIGLELTATAGGATVSGSCTHGSADHPIVLDADRHFVVSGTYSEAGPGPSVRTFPARFEGKVDGKAMVLSIVRTDTNEIVGTFDLVEGESGLIDPCIAA